jgi:aminoglycoside phosphotransferase (APT) family kinase protein
MHPICDVWDEGERSLIHGDSHLGNLFEDLGGPHPEIGFLDWAVASRGPGIRDVAYYLSNSMPTELRRAEERDPIRRYGDGLVAAGVEPPGPDALWHRYRLHVAYSWVAAAVTSAMGDKWQPKAVGLASMARATAAVDDLGTVDLLRDALGV